VSLDCVIYCAFYSILFRGAAFSRTRCSFLWSVDKTTLHHAICNMHCCFHFRSSVTITPMSEYVLFIRILINCLPAILYIRVVNIEVSSIVDILSPIFFWISIELSPILLKSVIDKVSAILLDHKYCDTNTFLRPTTIERRKHLTRPALA